MSSIEACAAKAREEAARCQRAGDAPGARACMRRASESLTSSVLMEDPGMATALQAQVRDLNALAERYEQHEFSEVEAKYQMQRSYNARRGKSTYDDLLKREP